MSDTDDEACTHEREKTGPTHHTKRYVRDLNELKSLPASLLCLSLPVVMASLVSAVSGIR